MTCCAAFFFEILNGLFFLLKKCASSETGAVCPESRGVQRALVWRKQLNIIKVVLCVCDDVRYVAKTFPFLVCFLLVCFHVFLFVWHPLHKWSWNSKIRVFTMAIYYLLNQPPSCIVVWSKQLFGFVGQDIFSVKQTQNWIMSGCFYIYRVILTNFPFSLSLNEGMTYFYSFQFLIIYVSYFILFFIIFFKHWVHLVKNIWNMLHLSLSKWTLPLKIYNVMDTCHFWRNTGQLHLLQPFSTCACGLQFLSLTTSVPLLFSALVAYCDCSKRLLVHCSWLCFNRLLRL